MILHDTAEAFLREVSPALAEREAEHSHFLGLAEALASGRLPEPPPILATMSDEGGLKAAFVRIPPRPAFVAATDASAVRALADSLYEQDPNCPGVVGSKSIARPFADAWTARSRVPPTLVTDYILYELTEVTAPVSFPPGHMRQAAAGDADLVYRWTSDFSAEAVPHDPRDRETIMRITRSRIEAGELYLWERAGAHVSMAGFAREMRQSISINIVYTPPECRGRGYASALVADMSTLALARGKQRCHLTADAANRTSNRIYQQIGYRYVCNSEFWSFGADHTA